MSENQKQQEYYDEEEKEETLATPGVIDKYKVAGTISNEILKKIIAKCIPGANITEICQFGDKEIQNELSKVYNKKRTEKGIAFPTCISLNEICGHFSPLLSDAPQILVEGDVAKIDLGVHIDGYISLVAHTIVVTGNSNTVVDGRKADVILAAQKALQGAFRLLKPGNKNTQVTQTIEKITESYKCNPIEGVLSHELKKHLIDGNNTIINKETFDQKVEDHEFQVNEVYAVDVIVSSGEGKPKESELRTTVFKRSLDKTYTLKTKHGRTFFNELIEKYPSLCFSLNGFEDEITAKIGVSDCAKHNLLVPYPILVEKKGEFVAHFKSTIMILQGQTVLISGLNFDEEEKKYNTQNKIVDQDLNTLLALKMDAASQKEQKKKQKKEQQQPVKEEKK